MKYSLLLILLILSGCHHQSWEHSFIRNTDSKYDLAKLTHPPSSPTHGIKLEITRCDKQIHGYINVEQFSFPHYQEDPTETTLTIETEGSTQTFIIPLLKGGQRARLTDCSLHYLLQILELKTTVTLISGHFLEKLDSSNFHRHYEALLRTPPRYIPETLVTFELY